MINRSTLTMLGLVLALTSVPAAAAESAATESSDASQTATVASIRAAVATPRPGIVPSLYVSLAALQAYDGYSTLHAVGLGAREVNPIVGDAAGKPAAMWTLKAASTAATIYYAERLWRQHRRGHAIALLVVANGMMGAVAAHNASVIRAMR